MADTINSRIAAVLKQSGKTQEEFVVPLHLSRSFIASVCSGVKQPSDRTILDICRVYGVSELWLREGQGEMYVQRTLRQEILDLARSLSEAPPGDLRRDFLLALADLAGVLAQAGRLYGGDPCPPRRRSRHLAQSPQHPLRAFALSISSNAKAAAPRDAARAFGERFFVGPRFGERRRTLCTSSFPNRWPGGKAPAKAAAVSRGVAVTKKQSSHRSANGDCPVCKKKGDFCLCTENERKDR